MNLIVSKVLVAVSMAILRFSFVYIPIKIHNFIQKPSTSKKLHQHTILSGEKRFSFYITMFHSFGAGVMLCTCLIHLLWEVHILLDSSSEGQIASFSQLLICIGFFVIYFVEEFSQWVLSKVPSSPLKYNTKSSSTICELLMSSIKQHISHCEHCTPFERQSNEDTSTDSMVSANMSIVFSKRDYAKFLFTETAIALHAIFEGLAIGLQCEEANIWYLSIGMAIHSATTLLYVGLNLIVTRANKKTILAHYFFLSVSNPCGILLGLFVSLQNTLDYEKKKMINAYMEALSAGTILYITFFDVLSKEKRKQVHRLYRGISMMLGFGLMCYLEYFAFTEESFRHSR
ncbi:hypothetical protein HHI36_012147 [Cryptolaemus montrouzieri]|uniref:Zinc transporter ZIP1 n=1 Tax=Cryptolaemus montrouzieri TaxID=559131 RepID=A0ABD2NDD9_9CUCU